MTAFVTMVAAGRFLAAFDWKTGMAAAGRFLAAFDSKTGMATSESDRRLARNKHCLPRHGLLPVPPQEAAKCSREHVIIDMKMHNL